MSAQVTTITVSPSDSSVITLVENQSTVISVTNTDTTVLQAAPAIIALGQTLILSNDIPLELAETGSAGISNTVSRSDHVHPSTGMLLNGGNF
jgi:hypothetical protein